MNYKFKVPDETGWIGLAAAIGGLVAAALIAFLGIDAERAVAIGGGVGTAFRYVVSFLLAFLLKDGEVTMKSRAPAIEDGT